MTARRTITVAAERLDGWLDRFAERHGELTWRAADDGAEVAAADGAVAVIRLAGPVPAGAGRAELVAAATGFNTFGLVLVRRGGYAIGRVQDRRLVGSSSGTRYVQGQTKAGGQSQKRYARRRANQAAALVRSAAEAVEEVLTGWTGPVVCGGDRPLVSQVFESARPGTKLDRHTATRWLDVPDPRRRVLQESIEAARAARIDLNELA